MDCDEINTPRAIQIVRPADDHKFKLNWREVQRIFEADNLRGHELVVISIAGDYRKGKSFLLNFFLRYLNAQYKKHDTTEWINNDEMLNGFSSKGGKDRHTIGIWMWSEIFTHEFKYGKKVAIVLLDTQGIFDYESDMKECISVFAMSMLLSSVQCYNVMRQVQENDLENLRLFTEYAKYAMNDTNERPFQNLLFIVRDWPSPYDREFGFSKDYVTKDILNKNPKQTTKMHELRDSIKNSFEKIRAVLLPYPGTAVARSKEFLGKTKDIDGEFVDCVKKLAEKLFSPEKLIRKKINGRTIQAAEFLELLRTYVDLFSGSEMPEPISMLQATAEAYLKACYNQSMDEYLNEIGGELQNTDVYWEDSELMDKHVKSSQKAVTRFQNRPKFGGLELQSMYLESLQKDMEKDYRTICKANEKERETVQSRQSKIVYSTTVGLTIVGGIAAAVVAGPLGLGLFAAASDAMALAAGGGATGGAVGGAGIGFGLKKLVPRSWLGTSSVLCATVENLKKSRKNRSVGIPCNILEEEGIAASSSGDIEMASDVLSNSGPTNNTSAFANQTLPTENSTPNTSRIIETNTITTYEFDTPADRVQVAEFCNTFSETNHFYIFTVLKNYILGFLSR